MRSLPLLLPSLLLLAACSQNPHLDTASKRAAVKSSSQNAVSNETPASAGHPDGGGAVVPEVQEPEEKPLPPSGWDGLLDSDGDGVPDIYDKCKYEPGQIFNDGCPIEPSEHVVVPAPTACPYEGAEEEEHYVIEQVRESLKFDFDRATIKPQSYPGLALLEQFLRKYPRSHLYMIGHTDDQGTEGYNFALSLARVRSVKAFLVARGIDGRRISVDAHGEDDPMVDITGLRGAALERARAENRRVDLQVRYETMERIR